MKKIILLFLLCISLFLISDPAYAYINPGSGADFFQIIFGTITSIGAFFKSIWCKIIGRKDSGNKDYE